MKLDREKFELAKARACIGTKEIIAAGIPKGTLCKTMNAKSQSRPETIGKIANVLGVDPLDIIE